MKADLLDGTLAYSKSSQIAVVVPAPHSENPC